MNTHNTPYLERADTTRIKPTSRIVGVNTTYEQIDMFRHLYETMSSIVIHLLSKKYDFNEKDAYDYLKDIKELNVKNNTQHKNDKVQVQKVWTIEEARKYIPKMYKNYTSITKLKYNELKQLATHLGIDTHNIKTNDLKNIIKKYIIEHGILPPPTRGRKKMSSTNDTTTSSVSSEKRTKTRVVVGDVVYTILPNDDTKMFNNETGIVYNIKDKNICGLWYNHQFIKLTHVYQDTNDFYIGVYKDIYYAFDDDFNIYKVDPDNTPHIKIDTILGKFEKGNFVFNHYTHKKNEKHDTLIEVESDIDSILCN